MPPHTGSFYKREIFQELGYYNSDFKIAGDFDHLLRIVYIKKVKFELLNFVVVRMKSGGLSGKNLKSFMIINKEIIESFNGIVFIDEAYIDYSNNSLISKVNMYQNLIISQTFSKALGLAGIRLGVGYSNSNIISYLKKVKPPYNINLLTEKKAIEKISSTYLDNLQIKETILERNKLVKKLENLPFVTSLMSLKVSLIRISLVIV